MKYIIAVLMILCLFSGCKTLKKISVSKVNTEAVSVRNEQQKVYAKVDSSFQIKGVDSYNIVTEILYQTDSTGKTAPIKKTIKKSGIKTKVKTAEHASMIVNESEKHDSVSAKTDVYTKDKDVKRNSNMTGIIIAVIAVVIFLIVKMIRNGK